MQCSGSEGLELSKATQMGGGYIPKGPCSHIVYTVAPKSYIGTTSRPKYVLFGDMDPQGTVKRSEVEVFRGSG